MRWFRRKPRTVTLRVEGANARDTGQEYTITEGATLTVHQPLGVTRGPESNWEMQGSVEIRLRCERIGRG